MDVKEVSRGNPLSRAMKWLINLIRFLLMPGVDLFTNRRMRLSSNWMKGPRRVLDAGSGNGWFSYLAWRSGATVVAANMAEDQVQKARKFYNEFLGIPTDELQFKKLNLYEVGSISGEFDEIICYETLEHIKDDLKVCGLFYKLLKPGGVLHLCCPHAEHPRWKNEYLDTAESGYHVRAGYTLASYRSLLEPIGFSVIASEGMGGELLSRAAKLIEPIRVRLGDLGTAPLFLATFPLIWLDPRQMECPYSLYVKARK